VWTASATTASAVAPASTCACQPIRPTSSTSAASATDRVAHGQGDGPGTHSMSPDRIAVRSPTLIGTCQLGETIWRLPRSRRTPAGSGPPDQCARWSWKIATGREETWRQSGWASALNSGGIWLGAVVARLEKVEGERWFSNTPPGPTRR
jgi:hypothetical protein